MLKKFKDSQNATSDEINSQMASDRAYCDNNFNTIIFIRPPSQYESRQGVLLYGEKPKLMRIFNFGYNFMFKDFIY